MLEVGKLYICNDYFLLLYPDREAAAAALEAGSLWLVAYLAAAAEAAAAYWSRELGKPVSYCDAAAPLLVLNTSDEYVEVLAGDRKGWIISKEWLKIEEIA